MTSQLDTVLLLNITASVCLQILLESYFSITFLYFRPHFIVVLKLLLFFSATMLLVSIRVNGRESATRPNFSLSLQSSVGVSYLFFPPECIVCKNLSPGKLTVQDYACKQRIIFATKSINSAVGDV